MEKNHFRMKTQKTDTEVSVTLGNNTLHTFVNLKEKKYGNNTIQSFSEHVNLLNTWKRLNDNGNKMQGTKLYIQTNLKCITSIHRKDWKEIQQNATVLAFGYCDYIWVFLLSSLLSLIFSKFPLRYMYYF